MNGLSIHKGLVAPLDRENVDTDAILPKQFLKRIKKTGYDDGLFYNWRYQHDGTMNEDFVLNKEEYRNATILLTRENFGCGSSREHAVWALRDYGFKVIIAPKFGDIFFNNCIVNGLLPLQLDSKSVEKLFKNCLEDPTYQVTVDVENLKIYDDKGFLQHFPLKAYEQEMLLKGLDEIDLTLAFEEDIETFEQKHTIYYRL